MNDILRDPRIEYYKRCFKKWGLNSQLLMLIEECSETIQAVSKVIRDKPLAINSLVAELVDLELMVQEAKYIMFAEYGMEPYFNMTMQIKLERLDGLLNNE